MPVHFDIADDQSSPQTAVQLTNAILAGKPAVVSVTGPVKPPPRTIAAAEVPVVPATIVAVAGVRVRPSVGVCAGAAVTTSVSVAVDVFTPEPLALIAIGYDPATVLAVVAIVTAVDAMPAPSVALANVTVAPAGAPSAVSATSPLKLPPRAIVAVDVPDDPATSVSVVGATATVSVAGRTWVVESLLPQPVTRKTALAASRARSWG